MPICQYVTKYYRVQREKRYGSIYSGDVEWIAYWFYSEYDQLANNITITIYGGEHQTYPNPPHLTLQVKYPGGYETSRIHLSRDENEIAYMQ